MGKRAREKKMARVAVVQAEKQAVEMRRATRVAPQLQYLRKITLAVTVTIFLLWVGSVVVERINQLVKG